MYWETYNNQKRTMGDYVNLDYFYPNRIKKPNVFNTYRLKRAFKAIGKPLAIIVPSALGLAAIFLSLDNDIRYPYGGMTNLFDKVASAAKDYVGNYPSNSNRTMADLFDKELERHAIMNGQRAIESCINANGDTTMKTFERYLENTKPRAETTIFNNIQNNENNFSNFANNVTSSRDNIELEKIIKDIQEAMKN